MAASCAHTKYTHTSTLRLASTYSRTPTCGVYAQTSSSGAGNAGLCPASPPCARPDLQLLRPLPCWQAVSWWALLSVAPTGPHREPPSAIKQNKRLALREESAQQNKTQVAAPKTTIHTAPHPRYASPGPVPVLPHIDPSKTHVQWPLKRNPWSIAAAVQRTCKKRRTNSHTCCCKPGSSNCAAAAVCNCTACVTHVPLVLLTAALHRVTQALVKNRPTQPKALPASGPGTHTRAFCPAVAAAMVWCRLSRPYAA